MTNYMSSLNYLTEIYNFCNDLSKFIPQNKITFLPTYNSGVVLNSFKIRSTIFLGDNKNVVKLLENEKMNSRYEMCRESDTISFLIKENGN